MGKPESLFSLTFGDVVEPHYSRSTSSKLLTDSFYYLEGHTRARDASYDAAERSLRHYCMDHKVHCYGQKRQRIHVYGVGSSPIVDRKTGTILGIAVNACSLSCQHIDVAGYIDLRECGPVDSVDSLTAVISLIALQLVFHQEGPLTTDSVKCLTKTYTLIEEMADNIARESGLPYSINLPSMLTESLDTRQGVDQWPISCSLGRPDNCPRCKRVMKLYERTIYQKSALAYSAALGAWLTPTSIFARSSDHFVIARVDDRYSAPRGFELLSHGVAWVRKREDGRHVSSLMVKEVWRDIDDQVPSPKDLIQYDQCIGYIQNGHSLLLMTNISNYVTMISSLWNGDCLFPQNKPVTLWIVIPWEHFEELLLCCDTYKKFQKYIRSLGSELKFEGGSVCILIDEPQPDEPVSEIPIQMQADRLCHRADRIPEIGHDSDGSLDMETTHGELPFIHSQHRHRVYSRLKWQFGERAAALKDVIIPLSA